MPTHNPISLENALNFPRKALLACIPIYFRHANIEHEEMPRRHQSTSALDGLRGIAALFVFFFHILFAYEQFVEYGYGQSKENRRFIQLPFVSLFYRGHSMVAIFFVVGGYVLSLKPLTLVHGHQPSAAHNVLVSSVFRRGFRLYIPAIVATFITMLTIYAGFWKYPQRFITNDKKYIYYADVHPSPQSTFKGQFWDWVSATIGLTDVFNYYNRDGFMMPYYNPYDPHLWTVPFEYRSSLLVTTVLLAFSRCKPTARILLTSSIVLFCGMWDRWELVCFLSGTLICDIDISLRSTHWETHSDFEEDGTEKLPKFEEMPLSSPTRLHIFLSAARRRTTTLIRPSSKRWIAVFALGLYLLSTPNFQIENTPGYGWLFTHLTPRTYTDQKRYLQSLGALLVTWSVANCSTIQKPFNTRFAQYLGKISYALYIVHGPLIHMVGYSVTPNIWIWVTGMETWRYWAGLAMGSTVLGVCVAIAADWFYRVVDVRVVKIARWFEILCFVRE